MKLELSEKESALITASLNIVGTLSALIGDQTRGVPYEDVVALIGKINKKSAEVK